MTGDEVSGSGRALEKAHKQLTTSNCNIVNNLCNEIFQGAHFDNGKKRSNPPQQESFSWCFWHSWVKGRVKETGRFSHSAPGFCMKLKCDGELRDTGNNFCGCRQSQFTNWSTLRQLGERTELTLDLPTQTETSGSYLDRELTRNWLSRLAQRLTRL